MLRKSSPRNAALVAALSLGGCARDPPPQPAETPPAIAAEAEAANISGFKFLRLGMTLEELRAVRADGFDSAHDASCLQDGRAILCSISGMSIAGAEATVAALFVATAPLEPVKQVPVPPLHQPSMQEVRMGNAEGENSKRAASIRAQRAAEQENLALLRKF